MTTEFATASRAQTGASVACLATHIPWAIDSGAFNHMIGSTSVLCDISISRRLHHVTLVDGSTLQIDGLGTANLFSSLSLPYVYYVPKFSFNFLSVSKLTKSLNCSVTFFPTHCVF